MFRPVPAALLWICIGIGLLGELCSRVPLLAEAEESLGLHWLYRMRGIVQPRADVAIVAIDRKSAQALSLPAAPQKWPRFLHARLLARLADLGARVVVFDLIFHEPQNPITDQAFASAIQKAGNVILTQTIESHEMPLSDRRGNPLVQLNIGKMVSALPIFADAAIGQAPFPLPKVPIKLNQYWCFYAGSGDTPTLPVAAMHAYAMNSFNAFFHLLQSVSPKSTALVALSGDRQLDVRQILTTMRPLRTLFEKDAALAKRMLEALGSDRPEQSALTGSATIRSFIQLYSHENSRYLYLYGPPGTIETISYHRLLVDPASVDVDDSLSSLKGKAVFVGQTESDWFKAHDGFYTAFTGASGLDISGVEIAATAFANLIENRRVHPLGPLGMLALFFIWGFLTTCIGFHCPAAVSATGLLLLSSLYLAVAHLQFKTSGQWMPLVVPILVQTPAAFIAGLVWEYHRANAERQNIREAFGYYLPDDVVDRLSAGIKEFGAGGQVLYSICLFTDAQNYTTLSERMDPESLTQFMNDYYKVIFRPIKDNGGIVIQVIGDSVLALWTAAEPSERLRSAACRAAVDISNAVDRFNSKAGPYLLPTRIGIHAGKILLGNIGAMDHFEYRPVGDIVNTASRLEGLNKYLSTQVLVSREALEPCEGVLERKVGCFVFKGKCRPVEVHELIAHEKRSPRLQADIVLWFEAGLNAYLYRRWDEAQRCFEEVLRLDRTDGPAQFYCRLCHDYRQRPPDGDWNGTIHLEQK